MASTEVAVLPHKPTVPTARGHGPSLTPASAPAAASPLPALPLELILAITRHLKTKDLSVLSRTCHALHVLLANELYWRFALTITDIFIWADITCRPWILDRAIATALTPDPRIPPSRRPRLRATLSMRLARLLSEPVEPQRAETVKVLIAHNITPIDPTDGIRPSRRYSKRLYDPMIPCEPAPTSRRWVMDGTHDVAWVAHAVRRGDLGLVRWLLYVAGANVVGDQTLLDFAMERRGVDPWGENVEEMIQLLKDRGLESMPPCEPDSSSEPEPPSERGSSSEPESPSERDSPGVPDSPYQPYSPYEPDSEHSPCEPDPPYESDSWFDSDSPSETDSPSDPGLSPKTW
ncbi:hypothetical protein DFP73DRAFT_561499 [Morchella snyderi]|nr:hypothetical protein DFP73DRAFT_561499 [Morchella snyderi]